MGFFEKFNEKFPRQEFDKYYFTVFLLKSVYILASHFTSLILNFPQTQGKKRENV